jgi:hypothetical protein
MTLFRNSLKKITSIYLYTCLIEFFTLLFLKGTVMKQLLCTLMLTAGFVWSHASLAVEATATIPEPTHKKLTEAQKLELYEKGIVTAYDDSGKKTGHYEIYFLPGAKNVERETMHDLKDAYQTISELATEKFWKNTMLAEFKDGINYMKRHVTEGVGTIPHYFHKTIESNHKLEGSFGATKKLDSIWRYCF